MSSHVLYKITVDERSEFKLKARIATRGDEGSLKMNLDLAVECEPQ